MPVGLLRDHAGLAHLGRLARAAFGGVRPLLYTDRPKARLRTVEHRGVATAAMVYDALPIIDVFRRVDDDTMLGLMDLRGLPQPFFFLLRRRLTQVGRHLQLGEQAADPALDLVADRAHRLDALARRVLELPVEVALAREDRAGVAAAHGDDDVGGLDGVGREHLRALVGDVDADLGHGLDGGRVDLVAGHRAGRADLDRVAGEVRAASRRPSGSGRRCARRRTGRWGWSWGLPRFVRDDDGVGDGGDRRIERGHDGDPGRTADELHQQEHRDRRRARCRRRCRTGCGRGRSSGWRSWSTTTTSTPR